MPLSLKASDLALNGLKCIPNAFLAYLGLFKEYLTTVNSEIFINIKKYPYVWIWKYDDVSAKQENYVLLLQINIPLKVFQCNNSCLPVVTRLQAPVEPRKGFLAACCLVIYKDCLWYIKNEEMALRASHLDQKKKFKKKWSYTSNIISEKKNGGHT